MISDIYNLNKVFLAPHSVMSLNKDIVFNHQNILARGSEHASSVTPWHRSAHSITKYFQSCKIPLLTGEIALSPTKDIQLVPVGFHLILPSSNNSFLLFAIKNLRVADPFHLFHLGSDEWIISRHPQAGACCSCPGMMRMMESANQRWPNVWPKYNYRRIISYTLECVGQF